MFQMHPISQSYTQGCRDCPLSSAPHPPSCWQGSFSPWCHRAGMAEWRVHLKIIEAAATLPGQRLQQFTLAGWEGSGRGRWGGLEWLLCHRGVSPCGRPITAPQSIPMMIIPGTCGCVTVCGKGDLADTVTLGSIPACSAKGQFPVSHGWSVGF